LKKISLVLLLLPSTLFGQVIPKYGNDTLLDIGTRNIEWFGDLTNGPSDEIQQFDNVKNIINKTDIDIWGIEEMSNTTSFNSLVTALPLYGGVNSTFSLTQKMCLLYKKSMFNLISAEQILTTSIYDFASRPPLLVRLSTKGDSINIDTLFVIVVHLKANSESNSTGKLESYNRRKRAADALKIYIESTLVNKKYIVLGDWNDRLDFSIHNGIDSTPFKQLLNANYNFITKPLADAGKRSYAFSDGFIDHIMVSPTIDSFHVKQSTTVLDNLGQFVNNYSNTTSDHYPVFGRFLFNKIKYTTPIDTIPTDTIKDTSITSIDYNVKSINNFTVYPNPFENCFTIKTENLNNDLVEIYSPIGNLIYSKQLNKNETEINLKDFQSGLYIICFKGKYYKILKY
jgi:hypothetical protein